MKMVNAKALTAFHIVFHSLLFLLAGLAALYRDTENRLDRAALTLFFYGVLLLAISKLPQILKGDIMTFGTKDLSPLFKAGYYLAYGLLVAGIGLYIWASLQLR